MKIEKMLVSEEDKDLLDITWYADRAGYAWRTRYLEGGKTKRLAAHRVVLSRMLNKVLVPSEICDHINGCVFDNRRENLRLTTKSGNAQNLHKCSPWRGTCFYKPTGRWRAFAKLNQIFIHIGYYDTREEALIAAKAKRKELGFLENTV